MRPRASPWEKRGRELLSPSLCSDLLDIRNRAAGGVCVVPVGVLLIVGTKGLQGLRKVRENLRHEEMMELALRTN